MGTEDATLRAVHFCSWSLFVGLEGRSSDMRRNARSRVAYFNYTALASSFQARNFDGLLQMEDICALGFRVIVVGRFPSQSLAASSVKDRCVIPTFLS